MLAEGERRVRVVFLLGVGLVLGLLRGLRGGQEVAGCRREGGEEACDEEKSMEGHDERKDLAPIQAYVQQLSMLAAYQRSIQIIHKDATFMPTGQARMKHILQAQRINPRAKDVCSSLNSNVAAITAQFYQDIKCLLRPEPRLLYWPSFPHQVVEACATIPDVPEV